MLYQTAKEQEASILLGSKQYKNPDNSGWHSDNRGDAVIHVLPRANTQVSSTERGNGYIRCVLDCTVVYSCYYPPNASLEIFQADLDDLEGSIRPGPIIVAGDFNAKSRSRSGGPEDRRGQLLDEMMVSLDLIMINHPGMATFERKASSSVLDLAFLRPTLRKDLREWTILEEESLSDHRYVCFEFKSRKHGAPRAKPVGWAVKKFDRDSIAECISETSELDKTRTTDELTRNYTIEISRANDAICPEDNTNIKGLLSGGTQKSQN